MQRFRRTSRERRTCRECGKVKRVNYFLSDTLCKKCGAKRRSPKPNPVITLPNGIQVTKRVHEGLRRDAEQITPKTWRSHLANGVLALSLLALIPFYLWFFFWSFQGYSFLLSLLVLLLGSLGIPITGMVFYAWLDRPRRDQVETTTLSLALDRQLRIEERDAFYASAEWRTVRDEVIQRHLAEHGKKCSACGRTIKKSFDLTVDHIKPRSRCPELALEVSNLRVMCRACNSSKSNYY